MRFKLKGTVILFASMLLLTGCSQEGNSQPNKTDKTIAKADTQQDNTTQTKVTSDKVNPLDKLTGVYRTIAKTVSEYKLPKEGLISEKKHPEKYQVVNYPYGVLYENGYIFSRGGQLVARTAPPGENVEEPTNGQGLGVIMGSTSDITDDRGDPKDMILGDTSHMTQEEWNKEETEAFKFNEGDIEHKLKRIAEMKPYTSNYPLIQKKLEEAEASFKEAQVKGKSPKTIQEAIALYEKGVGQIKALNKAFEVGQDIKLKAFKPS